MLSTFWQKVISNSERINKAELSITCENRRLYQTYKVSQFYFPWNLFQKKTASAKKTKESEEEENQRSRRHELFSAGEEDEKIPKIMIKVNPNMTGI